MPQYAYFYYTMDSASTLLVGNTKHSNNILKFQMTPNSRYYC